MRSQDRRSFSSFWLGASAKPEGRARGTVCSQVALIREAQTSRVYAAGMGAKRPSHPSLIKATWPQTVPADPFSPYQTSALADGWYGRKRPYQPWLLIKATWLQTVPAYPEALLSALCADRRR